MMTMPHKLNAAERPPCERVVAGSIPACGFAPESDWGSFSFPCRGGRQWGCPPRWGDGGEAMDVIYLIKPDDADVLPSWSSDAAWAPGCSVHIRLDEMSMTDTDSGVGQAGSGS